MEGKMKKYLICLVAILSLFLITGCGKNKAEETRPHTKKEIKELDKKSDNFSVKDGETDVKIYEYFGTIYNNEGNIISFIVCKDEDTANNLYTYYSSTYQNLKKDNDIDKKVKNTSYELTTKDKYYYVRVDKKTLVVTETSASSKKSVKKTLKEINY
jgi:predicted small lipoprotein YifL